MRILKSEAFRNSLYIIAGLLLSASAYRMFLVPNEIAPGGFTGVGQLVQALIGVKVGTVTIILNVPLFMICMRSLGVSFGVRSLVSSVLLSFFIDYLPIPPATDDLILAAVFGGVVGGIGFGLILRGNATTGGSDMLGALIHSKIPSVKVGVFVFAVDAVVITASAFVFSSMLAMYALISAVIMNYMLDFVLEGGNMARAYIIISSESEKISQAVLIDMSRGVTGLKGKGMYSGDDREVLLCVINRMESMRLRRIVRSIDPKAFVIAVNAHEVLGEGFKDIFTGKSIK